MIYLKSRDLILKLYNIPRRFINFLPPNQVCFRLFFNLDNNNESAAFSINISTVLCSKFIRINESLFIVIRSKHKLKYMVSR